MTATEPTTARQSTTQTGGAPLGPGSLTWRHFGERLILLQVGCIGTLQNMHPAVGQSLQEVSNFFIDPTDRIVRSIPPIMGVVYDDPQDQTGVLVRDFHKNIKGNLPDGSRYHALDPDTFWWTHATFIMTVLNSREFFGTPFSEEEKDQLVREGVTWWQRYGLSMKPVIYDYPSFKTYWDKMLAEVLESNKTTDFATGRLSRIAPPQTLPIRIPAAVWFAFEPLITRINVWLMAAMMPERGREILGLSWSRTDQRIFTAFQRCVRTVWPHVPNRVKYFPRARIAIAKYGL